MRRLALIGWVLALGGCNALRDTFAGRQQTVGTAAGQTLTVEHLASLVGHAQRQLRRLGDAHRRHTSHPADQLPRLRL